MAPPLGPDIVPGGNQDWQFVRYDFQAFYHVIGFQNDDCCNYQIFSCFGDSDSDLIFCKKCTWAHTCQFEESVAPFLETHRKDSIANFVFFDSIRFA